MANKKENAYISTGGTLNATQPDLILAAIRKMPDEGKIINAVDNDDGGDRLTILLNDILARIPGPARALTDDRPLDRGMDWNDVLRSSSAQQEH
jgi:Toprim-like